MPDAKTDYVVTTIQVVPEGETEPVALHIRIAVSCDLCAGFTLELWGHHVRGIKDVLEDVLRVYPQLTTGGELSVAATRPAFVITPRPGNPSDN